ncbi:restriction endonuclease subunit m [Streptomyces xiamenensis]|uniref:site-specific DNA-methyltransferase (adenine-specific) n=1 Tax=Streptomyces xiamenensis TaxID=408015 RepID=A0A0F7FV97_9ACTN|nr:hypothetical protein [Streptomyces xiamenensis]AKG43782.1 restriction endonuclease subunit m [Streptomyces xiamenensis]
MSAEFPSLVNRGEYFTAHYYAEQLGTDLRKGLLATWSVRENDELEQRRTPREALRSLRMGYVTDERRGFFTRRAHREDEAGDDALGLHTHQDPEWRRRLTEWHREILRALGYGEHGPDRGDGPADAHSDPGSEEITVRQAGRDHTVRVAWHGDGIIALDCGWTADTDAAVEPEGPGRLLHPVRISAAETLTSGAALASWLFHSDAITSGGPAPGPDASGPGADDSGTDAPTAGDTEDSAPATTSEAPRFVLLLAGGVLVLADRTTWGEGRHLAVSLDTALEHNDRTQTGELATIAALFSHEALRPGDNGEAPLIDALLKSSGENAVGVSGELRHGLQRSVEIIANEVLDRLRATGLTPADIEDPAIPIEKELTRETLRYLYRVLFLLYAEARPELGILPADDRTYEAGYSMARLRELVARDVMLTEQAARDSCHLYESLNVLFAKVNFGHRPYGTEEYDDQPGDDEETRREKAARRSRDRGLRFEPLHSVLFDPKSIRLIGRGVRDPRRTDGEEPAWLDLRPRNQALHEVLRLLTMKRAEKRGRRGGFISYRNLGINQLGAVYEGLMSYTGRIAEEELREVAKNGKPEGGSWLIPASRQQAYDDSVFVHYGEEDERKGLRGRKVYEEGRFVYRLAGRDRETSASYYTPESLTKVTVELALRHLLDQEKDDAGEVVETRAAELLTYRICEPALGSGAFLNEAINQVADEYIRRRQKELGRPIPTADQLTEKQKVKAYIALHNAYGVDLNATGVELAEVSMWLNTMHPGMRAPWFGLHLRRGNSLIGGRRAVYAAEDVVAKEKLWLKPKGGLPPTDLPFRAGGGGETGDEAERQELPDGAIHHFLLPAPGWGAVAGEAEAKRLAPVQAEALAKWRRGIRKPPNAKATGGRRSQLERMQAVARRAEFLWDLVIRRMQLSEEEISRRIEVWGADPADPEYAFLRWPDQPVPKEKVFRDLFGTTGTPYWRLKTVMDAWCALWFWPVDKAGLVDGTDAVYEETASSARVVTESVLAALPQVGEQRRDPEPPQPQQKPEREPQPVAAKAVAAAGMLPEQGAMFVVDGEQTSLFAEMVTGEEDSGTSRERLAESAPQPRRRQKKTAPGGSKAGTPTPSRGMEGRRARIPLATFEDWLDFAEALLGTYGEAGDLLEADSLLSLDDIEAYERGLEALMGMDEVWRLEERFPWLAVVQEIAAEQGFLHWELDFGFVFSQRGGFDLQVGNPPWVRPRWNEPAVLAEFDPWFLLQEKASNSEKVRRRGELLEDRRAKDYVLRELTSTSGTVAIFGSSQMYPFIEGTQPDLYRAFMCQTWDHASAHGTVGLVHPDSHFSGDKELTLRENAYSRLRVHADFLNPGHRFFPRPVDENTHFGVHIYGSRREIAFDHLSWLVSPDTLRYSGIHDGSGEFPGIKLNGDWDVRPHLSRVVRVDRDLLARWQRLDSRMGGPPEQGRLLSLVSTGEMKGIDAIASYPFRLADENPQISSGFHESSAKKEGLIKYELSQPESWGEVVLKGVQIALGTAIFKDPNAGSNDVLGRNLLNIPDGDVPSTEYVRAVSTAAYRAAQDAWVDWRLFDSLISSPEELEAARGKISASLAGSNLEVDEDSLREYLQGKSRRPYSDFYRLAWRRQVAPNTERSLYAAIIPPGAVHVNAIHSLAMENNRQTALVSGFWSSIPLDYLLRVSARSDLGVVGARNFPTPVAGHPLSAPLLLRTLRLNCLTSAYGELWNDVYETSWQREPWAYPWSDLQPLGDVSRLWGRSTPLRSERARRSALVELDALVAVWIGVSADALIAMYRSRFPVLQRYDDSTWFDVDGWKIAGVHRTHGQRQKKEHWEQFERYLEDPENTPPPEGYTAPFYKADREKEMREAHAVFKARLDAAIARGEWDPETHSVPGT